MTSDTDGLQPPWWHTELADKVEALDGKLDRVQGDLEQLRGMLRLLAALGTFLLVAATVAGPIILAVHG